MEAKKKETSWQQVLTLEAHQGLLQKHIKALKAEMGIKGIIIYHLCIQLRFWFRGLDVSLSILRELLGNSHGILN